MEYSECILRLIYISKMTNNGKKIFKFVDLFAGIGGFHQAMNSIGGKCVFASEWDKYARISYEANYGELEPELFEKRRRSIKIFQ